MGTITGLPEPSAVPTITGPVAKGTDRSFLYKMPAEFFGQFLLILVALLFSLVWKAIDVDFKRIELWYQLSQSTGVSGNRLMQTNLVFANTYAVPFLAIDRGQWIPALSSFIYCPLFSTAQLLASTTVFVQAEGACTVGDGDPNCRAYVAIRPFMARALQAVLAAIALAVSVLAVLQRARRSKLLLEHEPFSIGGLGMLMMEPTSLELFQGFEPTQSGAELKRLVSHTRFRLSQRAVGDGGGSKPVLETVSMLARPDSGKQEPPRASPRNVKPNMLRGPVLITFAVFLLGVMAILLFYRFGPLSDRLVRFMDSQKVGPRILATSLGLVIRSLWEPIERGMNVAFNKFSQMVTDQLWACLDIRYLEPFRLLRKRNQPPGKTIFADYLRDMPFIAESYAISKLNPHILAVGTIGLAVEALVMLLSVVPFSGGTTWRLYNIATFACVAITGLVVVTLAITAFNRRYERMPRLPYSIPEMASYLYAARMVPTLGEMALCSSGGGAIGGKRYGFGWTEGSDGVVRVGVDEEELKGDYKGS